MRLKKNLEQRAVMLLTRVWVYGEVRLALQYAVDQFSAVPIHGVISIRGCHPGDRGTCGEEEREGVQI